MNLQDMTNVTKTVEMAMRNYWCSNDCSFNFYRELSRKKENALSKWTDSINEYPNSVAHHENLVHFLIECTTDFEQAITYKHKSNLIQKGMNNSVDHCYQLFVRKFPIYLKKKILDAKGKFVIEKEKKPRGGSSKGDFVAFFDIIDAQNEEEICNQILTQPKTRLALQRAFLGQSPKYSSLLSKYGFFVMTVSIILNSVLVF